MCKSKARLDGKVAVVTGGGSGMGYEAAKDLASRGARVIIASRNATKLRIARDNIRRSACNQNVDFKVLNLESFQSVRQFSHEIQHEHRLDMLINTAGGIGLPDRHTEDGLSLMMQVNFFGAFLLTYLLLPMLKSSAPSRIINSSAITMHFGHIDFNHWNDLGKYSYVTASGNAKLAVALISTEWDRRLKGTRVSANSFDPFFVKDTDIFNYLPEDIQNSTRILLNILGLPRKDVGEQIAYYASAPELEGVSGVHYNFCAKWPNHPLARDLKLRKKLWREAKKIVKITPEEDWEVKPCKEDKNGYPSSLIRW